MKYLNALRILNLEKVKSGNIMDASLDLRGIYTLGLLSKPRFITVSSQQNRAEALATAIVTVIKKSSKKKEGVILSRLSVEDLEQSHLLRSF